jgi:predicted nuclease with TOPRIM domain
VAIHDGVSYHEHDMLTKEELDEIKRAWGDGNPKSVVCLLLSHIDEQEAELNGRQATLDVLDAEITSLRETVRFLNDAVRVLEAKLWGKP